MDLAASSLRRTEGTRAFEADVDRRWIEYRPEPRPGLVLAGLGTDARKAVFRLVATSLSPATFAQTMAIIGLEEVLDRREGYILRRHSEDYRILVFGTPGDDRWGWRFEGHHLSGTMTIADGVVSPALVAARRNVEARPVRLRLAHQRVSGTDSDAGQLLIQGQVQAHQRIRHPDGLGGVISVLRAVCVHGQLVEPAQPSHVLSNPDNSASSASHPAEALTRPVVTQAPAGRTTPQPGHVVDVLTRTLDKPGDDPRKADPARSTATHVRTPQGSRGPDATRPTELAAPGSPEHVGDRLENR